MAEASGQRREWETRVLLVTLPSAQAVPAFVLAAAERAAELAGKRATPPHPGWVPEESVFGSGMSSWRDIQRPPVRFVPAEPRAWQLLQQQCQHPETVPPRLQLTGVFAVAHGPSFRDVHSCVGELRGLLDAAAPPDDIAARLLLPPCSLIVVDPTAGQTTEALRDITPSLGAEVGRDRSLLASLRPTGGAERCPRQSPPYVPVASRNSSADCRHAITSLTRLVAHSKGRSGAQTLPRASHSVSCSAALIAPGERNQAAPLAACGIQGSDFRAPMHVSSARAGVRGRPTAACRAAAVAPGRRHSL